MIKIVINTCFGGFSLSEKAEQQLIALGVENPHSEERDFRADPRLVQVVQQLGDEAGDIFTKLKIVEIPDNIKWEIESDSGKEWVSEVHKRWR